MDQYQLTVQICTPQIVRVTYHKSGTQPQKTPIVCQYHWDAVPYQYTSEGTRQCYDTGALRMMIDGERVSFYSADGALLLEEAGERRFTDYAFAGTTLTAGRCAFLYDETEGIYGYGQYPKLPFNRNRSQLAVLEQENLEIASPMYLSSKGYGLLWNNCSATRVALEGNRRVLVSEAAPQIDYYFMYGPDLNDVVRCYRQVTGDAPMLGKWAFGLWQCRERYHSQAELIEAAQKYRQNHIPIDNMIQDWKYWGKHAWGSHAFDSDIFPDPKGMVDWLHQNQFHCMISVWPKYHKGSENYTKMDAAGYLYPNGVRKGKKFEDRYYDTSDPAARALHWEFMNQQIFAYGFDAWWLDGCEPETTAAPLEEKEGGNINKQQQREFETAKGLAITHLNDYSLYHCLGVYEGQRAQTDEKRVFLMARSAMAGQQRYAGTAWSGDITASWNVFAKQVEEGLNFCATGQPYWNTDIGGFFGNVLGQKDEQGRPLDTEYRELFIRWFQYGAFCPIFRVHGTQQPKELWRFLEYGYRQDFDILLYYDCLRYRLLPYIYSTAAAVTRNGATMMRPLVMDFREDARVLDIGGQFLFGPSLMAVPVTEYRQREKEVYFPEGAAWYDFETGRMFSGGSSAMVSAPLEQMPLYVRAGAIIPMGEVVEYTAQQAGKPLEIRVYDGADGSFALYDDEGDSYRYEQGMYEMIPLSYDSAAKQLHIGARQGSYPGMQQVREFHVVCVNGEQRQKTVRYDGAAQVVQL